MPSPYGLRVIESCLACPVRRDHLLCNLSAASLQALDSITSSAVYPKGALLFVEGQPSRGIFIICAGQVKLSTSSPEGKTMIVRIVEDGEVVGLPAAISNRPHEASAETLLPTQANFIPRQEFLRFLTVHSDVALRAAEVLSNIYFTAYDGLRGLGLGYLSSQKLALFLLDWSERPARRQRDGRSSLTLNQEEIAQKIGTSRETVTRLLSELRKNRVVQLKDGSLIICDRAALEKMAGHTPAGRAHSSYCDDHHTSS